MSEQFKDSIKFIVHNRLILVASHTQVPLNNIVVCEVYSIVKLQLLYCLFQRIK